MGLYTLIFMNYCDIISIWGDIIAYLGLNFEIIARGLPGSSFKITVANSTSAGLSLVFSFLHSQL